MPRVSSLAREEAFEKLRNGLTAEEVADEYGVSTATAMKWAAEATGEPTLVTPPSIRSTGPRGRKKLTVKPISDETAGMICAALFSIAALVDQEPLWYLTDTERKALAEPLAASLAMLPGRVADAVNTYTAPGVLVTVSATIINHKLQYRAAKRSGKLRVVSTPQNVSASTPKEAPSQATEPNNQEPNNQVPNESPPQPTQMRIDPAVTEMLNRSRGNLSEPEDDGESILSRGFA